MPPPSLAYTASVASSEPDVSHHLRVMYACHLPAPDLKLIPSLCRRAVTSPPDAMAGMW